ncbi:hypothetical protein [Saccharibacillus kuerlensis]|uniref:NERD domain-containing protein n=1 Tax=Saccharibacillus kuerlensis TaxID=459527 RepID=A0ABQ2L3A1_9BACL|nr:hypothetical protein [Saccharibacillus kuerlensis]GGN98569.1 hypothetical protein GCM10010969_17830 [Saccharibacillus kuerlensis]
MEIYKLERLTRREEEFLKHIHDTIENLSLKAGLDELKKSGICIDIRGTGKPRDNKLYKKIIDDLKNPINQNEIENFQKEVEHLNNLYSTFTNVFLKKVDDSLSDELYAEAFLIALEHELSILYEKKFGFGGLNDNKADLIENITIFSGAVLKYMRYKKISFNKVTSKIERKYINNAKHHLIGVDLKNTLDTMLELWTYFEAELDTTSSFCVTAKGKHALGKNITHMKFMDIRNAKISRFAYEKIHYPQKYEFTGVLPPQSFISMEEKMACEFIEEYFSTSDLSIKFNDISLAELVRAYSVVSLECRKFLESRILKAERSAYTVNEFCITRTKNKWIKKFVEHGLDKKAANKVFDFMKFDNSSEDLIDNPFIEFGKYYVVVPTACVETDPSRAIMNNFTNRNIGVNLKGTMFEKEISNSLNEVGIKCLPLRHPKYECDALFVIDDILFFVEAKHLRHPVTYKEYAHNLDKISDACKQLDRISAHYMLEENLVKIKEKLNVKNIKSFYKIVVVNTSQGEKLNFNGVQVTDATSFNGYFKRTPPRQIEIKGRNTYPRELFSEYYKGDINAEQFIDFLETAPTLDLYKKRITYQEFDEIESIGFKLIDFYPKINSFVNLDSLSEIELKEFNEVYGTDFN